MNLQSTIIVQSFKHIIASGPQVIDHAYGLTLKMYPELASILAKYDYDILKDQVLNSLIFIADHLDEEQISIDYLKSLGIKLRTLELEASFFEQAKDVMMRSIASFLNEKWTPKTEEQWSLGFDLINYHIMKGAKISMGDQSPIAHAKQESKDAKLQLETSSSQRLSSMLEPSLQSSFESESLNQDLSMPEAPKQLQVDLSSPSENSDNFSSIEREMKAQVSLTPEHIEKIQVGAVAYAKQLVSEYWKEAFNNALENELSEIDAEDEISKPNPDAA